MNLKLSYKQRIFLYFSIIIAVFTTGIILFEQHQIKKEREQGFERMLNNNVEIIHYYLHDNALNSREDMPQVTRILRYMPKELRLTIIDWQGNVLFDNRIHSEKMENHLHRPEIQQALLHGVGTNARLSSSNHIKYLYYARKYEDGYFVRVALPYDMELASFLNSKNSFVYFIVLFFIVSVLMMMYFANRFSKSIKELRSFSQNLKNGIPDMPEFKFTDDEVGAVSSDIVENYNLLQENRKKLAMEREKLLQHFQYSEEGIAIFSAIKHPIYANSHFLQFFNMIIDKPVLEVESVFSDPNFEDFVTFIDSPSRAENMYTRRIEKNGKQFNVRVIVFDDDSFELYISDITKSEKTRLLKQEMTNNIAHELRTPVTSIRGYLETIQSLSDEDVKRRNNFLERAYAQTIRLSELIQDISMLTKIEEASDRFQKERVSMYPLLEELGADLAHKFKEKRIRYHVYVNNDVIIYGSRTLLYSIFRNLAENTIAYAGENIDVVIRCYSDGEGAYYFEYYDTGVGVEEKHMVRIFERFYRINEGRTRNTGGSGLGLSIVKNAVLFHKGSIVAKNRPEGGLLFLITFPVGQNNCL